jgi:hypothetical protein
MGRLFSSLTTTVLSHLAFSNVNGYDAFIMAKGNPNWGRSEPVNWRFRVRGKNRDGDMVTLGSYRDEAEARARYNDLVKEGYYRLLSVQSLKPKPADPKG